MIEFPPKLGPFAVLQLYNTLCYVLFVFLCVYVICIMLLGMLHNRLYNSKLCNIHLSIFNANQTMMAKAKNL